MNKEKEDIIENETGGKAAEIVFSDLFVYIFGVVAIACVIFLGIYVKQTNLYHPQVFRTVMKQDKTYKNLKKEDYISLKDYDKLFHQAVKYSNFTLLNKMNNAKVIDTKTGKIYRVEIDAENKVLDKHYHLVRIKDQRI